MKRISLVLFWIPISLSAFFIIGTFLNAAYIRVPFYVIPGSLISFFVGLFIYSKLSKMVSDNMTDKNWFVSLWILMILSFFLMPTIYFIGQRIEHDRVAKLNVIWNQEHCKTVVTKEHHYSIEFCDIWMPRSTDGPRALDEYNKENPDHPYILDTYDINWIKNIKIP